MKITKREKIVLFLIILIFELLPLVKGASAKDSSVIVPSLCDQILLTNKDNPNWILLGPDNGQVDTIERSENGELFAGTSSGGVFKSKDNGNNWEHYSNGLDSSNINHLKFINNELYAATGDGIYLLEGTSWKNILKPNTPTKFLFIDYNKLSGKFWALSDDGLYTSGDGKVWSNVGTPGNSQAPFALMVSKNGHIYVSNIDGLFKSENSGVSWQNIFPSVISIVEDNQGNVYATDLLHHKLYKKLWDENNFQELTAAPGVGVGNIVYNKGNLYVGTFNAIYVSSDDGQTFTKIAQSNSLDISQDNFWDIRQIYPIGDNRIILANDNGVSEINTLTKSIKQYQIKGYSEIVSLATSSKSVFLLTSYFDHVGVISNNCGTGWSNIQGWEDSYYFLEPKNNQIFMMRDYNSFNLFLSSSPSTTFWSLPSYGYGTVANPRNSIAFDTSKNPTKAYVINETFNPTNGFRQGILVNFNMVLDVTQLNVTETILPFAYLQSIVIDPNNGARIVISANGNLYESLDKGSTWSKLAELKPYQTFYEIAINPFNSDEIVVGGFEGNILQVKNGKVNYISLLYDTSKTLNNLVYAVSYDDLKPNVIYAGSQQGFFYSTDNGLTWKQFNGGLYAKDIRKITPKNDKIFIGTWGSGNAVILKEKILKEKSLPVCGNNICEEGEADYCPPCTKPNPPCKAPCKVGTCPQDCKKPKMITKQEVINYINTHCYNKSLPSAIANINGNYVKKYVNKNSIN